MKDDKRIWLCDGIITINEGEPVYCPLRETCAYYCPTMDKCKTDHWGFAPYSLKKEKCSYYKIKEQDTFHSDNIISDYEE